jgi:hypothetical protein
VRVAATLALAATLATPAAAQRGCVTRTEAESLTLAVLPDVILEAGRVCAASVPATSLLRRQAGPFIAKYRVAADAAWPAAVRAATKFTDPSAASLLQSGFARPLLATVVAPLILGQVQAGDCPAIDRFATLLEPLPPRNVAGLVVTALTWLKGERARGRRVDVPDLPLCSVK